MFPFVAVQGQEKLKKALCLSVINPKIGGVLISGEKGTGKTTLVRGLEEVLCNTKVVNLPLNITEDNLTGMLDIEKTLKLGKKQFQYGLLKEANKNILYVDEINLLGENITNKILETVAIKENYVEREGLSFSHESDFILIGSMNPEEGELRPHFLDKFGLFVHTQGIKEVGKRVRIIKDRLEFEKESIKFIEKYREKTKLLAQQILEAKKNLDKIKVSEQIMRLASKVIIEANAQGNRAEIILIETAKAIASLEKRNYLNAEDIKEAMEFVLPHRICERKENDDSFKNNCQDIEKDREKNENLDNDRNNANDDNGGNAENREENFDNKEEDIEDSGENIATNEENDEIFQIGKTFKIKEIVNNKLFDEKKRKGYGKRCKTKVSMIKGRYVKSIKPKNDIYDLAFDATLRAAAPYQIYNEDKNLKIKITKENIRVKVREKRTGTTILFVVDSSGSMGAKKRMITVKAAIMSLLKDAYEKRDKVGMVSFRKDRGEEILKITRSVDLAKKKLKNLSTGGKTPLGEGILKGFNILKKEIKKDKESIPIMILISDGKANYSRYGENPVEESLKIAAALKQEKIKKIVIDSEEGFVKLGLAKTLAEKMGATYYKLEDLKAQELIKVINNNK